MIIGLILNIEPVLVRTGLIGGTFELHFLVLGLLVPDIFEPLENVVPDEPLVLVLDVVVYFLEVPVQVSDLGFGFLAHVFVVTNVPP